MIQCPKVGNMHRALTKKRSPEWLKGEKRREGRGPKGPESGSVMGLLARVRTLPFICINDEVLQSLREERQNLTYILRGHPVDAVHDPNGTRNHRLVKAL